MSPIVAPPSLRSQGPLPLLAGPLLRDSQVTFSPAFRRLVYATAVVAFLVASWGGVVRVTGSGLGCPDWPLCHGQFLPSFDAPTLIEWLHRFLALLLGAGIAAVALWAARSYARQPAVVALAWAALALFAGQALLGAITVVLELPPTVVTAHLAGAQLLLADTVALAILVTWPSPGLARPDRLSWLALASALGTFALILSGAYVRGSGVTGACPDWPLCGGAVLPAGEASLVHMLHRYLAVLVGVMVLYTALAAWRRRGEVPGLGALAAATGTLFVAQVVLGALNPLTGFAPLALGAHPAVASALWASTVALAVVAWRPAAPQAVATLRDLIALTKPAIMSLLLVTAVGAMFLAARGVPPLPLLAVTVVGGALASGGASALNHYFDRDIDLRMRRTRDRPLPARRISGRLAVGLGVSFNVAAFAVLALGANLLAAALAVVGTLFYIFVYTLWLKRTTTQNIVIGGAAGAIPPLVGWAAVAGSLDLAAWLLFAIVFFWTPAHFWALALIIRDDYERAGIPMLPVVRGDAATTRGILAYACSLVPLTVLLFVIGAAGPLYLVVAVALGVAFVGYAVRLLRSGEARRRAVARGVYLYSLAYLALLFAAIMVDSAIRL